MARDRYTGQEGVGSIDNIVSKSAQEILSTITGEETSNIQTTQQGSSYTENAPGFSIAALRNLIAALQEGGTPDIQRQQQERATEIARNRATQGGYTKEAAGIDAQAFTNTITRQLMERTLPQISRAAEGAGTSQNAFRALLTQDAQARAAEQAATLAANLGVQYGQVNNQLASTLELLTRPDQNSIANLLLQAINISKGLTQSTSSSQTTNQVGQKTTNQQQLQQIGPQQIFTDYAPFEQQLINDYIRQTIAPSYTPASAEGYLEIRPGSNAMPQDLAYILDSYTPPESSRQSTPQYSVEDTSYFFDL